MKDTHLLLKRMVHAFRGGGSPAATGTATAVLKKSSAVTAALCAVFMLVAGTANAAGTWTYDSSARTITHSDGAWRLSVSVNGSNHITITGGRSAGTLPASHLPLNDPVLGGYTITAIGTEAFAENTRLSSVTLPDSLTLIGYQAFSFSSLTHLTIGSGTTSIDEYALFLCFFLESISAPPSNPAFKSVNGVLFSKDETVLVRYPSAAPATTYSIPNSVTTLHTAAFGASAYLTSVDIPNSVTHLQDNIFYLATNLTSITFPASVVSIGVYPFQLCSNLTHVVFEGTHPSGWLLHPYVGFDETEIGCPSVTTYIYNTHLASWNAAKYSALLGTGPIENGAAQWWGRPIRIIDPTVIFDGNGGTPTTNVVQNVLNGYLFPTTNPTRTGHAFSHWATTSGGGTSVAAGSAISNSADPHTLYAQWVMGSASIAVKYMDATTGSPSPIWEKSFSGTQGAQVTFLLADAQALVSGETGYANWNISSTFAGVPSTFDAGAIPPQTITVSMTHKTTPGAPKTTTRTINYTGAVSPSVNPNAVVQSVVWTTVKDEVTGAITYTPGGNYAAVSSPSLQGYTPSLATVAGVTLSATTTEPGNLTETVRYTGKMQTIKVVYVDDDNGGVALLNGPDVTGPSDSAVTFTPTDYSGNHYLYVSHNTIAQFDHDDAANQTITVHLKHAVTTAPLFVTRIITHTADAGATFILPGNVSQTITWDVETDLVTSAVKWRINDGSANKTFAAYTPPVFAGFTAANTDGV